MIFDRWITSKHVPLLGRLFGKRHYGGILGKATIKTIEWRGHWYIVELVVGSSPENVHPQEAEMLEIAKKLGRE